MTAWPDERTKTRLRVWGFIENLVLSEVSSFDLGQNFRIRRTTEAEQHRPFEVEGTSYQRDSRLPDIDNPGTIIETVAQAELPPENLYNLSNLLYFTSPFTKEVTGAVTSLHYISRAWLLFSDAITKLKLAKPEVGDLQRVGRSRPIFSQPKWAMNLFSKYKLITEIGARDLEEFKKFFWGYSAIKWESDFLASAIGRFGQASEMAGHLVDLETRFIHYIRSLEALLGAETEITRTLASRTSALIGGSPDERQDTYDFIKGAYDWRSRSVHGGDMLVVEVRGSNANTGYGTMEDVDMLHWYCRLSIRRIVDLILAITAKEPLASTWKEMGKSKKKGWVVGLLDYSIVRDDLAKSLEGFYNGTTDITELCETYGSVLRRPFGGISSIWCG